MITVMHGAIKNVGDFLILDRCLTLLEHVVPGLPVRPVLRATAAGRAELLAALRNGERVLSEADWFCVFHRGIADRRQSYAKDLGANGTLAAAAAALGFRVVNAAGRLDRIDFYREADLHVGYRVHPHLAFLSYRRPSILISEKGRGVGQAMSLDDPYAIRAFDGGTPERVASALDAELRTFEATDRAVAVIERTWPVMRHSLARLSS